MWPEGRAQALISGATRLRDASSIREPRKGLHVFARIAEVLARRRPDIPLLLVEGAAAGELSCRIGHRPWQLKNIKIMPNTPDPRGFYAVTRLASDALADGECSGLWRWRPCSTAFPSWPAIGAACRRRSATPAFLFDIPAKYTPETRDLPTAEEVEPWVETIIRLWDDAAEYERWSRAARERAQQWHPDRFAPIYREFFSRITHQPGPPLVPRELIT